MDTTDSVIYVRSLGSTETSGVVEQGSRPHWRNVASTLTGYGLIAAAVWVVLTYRATWISGPADMRNVAPYAVSISLLMVGLIALSVTQQWAKRLWRTILGSALILAGIAMLLLPGPGLVTIAAGLLVLSREYAWARRRYEWMQSRLDRAKDVAMAKVRARRELRWEVERTTAHPETTIDITSEPDVSFEEDRRIA